MKNTSLILPFVTATFLALANVAQAQATRTWVSGVGDDANPCSRTAPCKTFAGAISKTAANGEINVLDPGGFGGVTITKSITIDGTPFTSGVLVSGTNAIVVNAGPNDVVNLRGLDIDGLGGSSGSLAGVRVIAGKEVHVENCTIFGFGSTTNGYGISFEPAAAAPATSSLFVNHCTLRDNAAGGILVKPGSNVTARAIVSDTHLISSGGGGLRVEANGVASATRVYAAGNSFAGFNVLTGGVLNASSCVASQNMWGFRANGGTIRITDCTVANNSADGLLILAGGALQSFGDNKVAGNSPDGNATSMLAYH